jgi:hypothetical protein
MLFGVVGLVAALAAGSPCAGPHTLGNERVAYAAAVRESAKVYRAPGLQPFARFGRLNANGARTVFGIVSAAGDRRCSRWYRVQLPLEPNGITGYVRERDLLVGRVATRIAVDLSERRLVLLRRGRPVLRIRVGIGASATPTPVGRYYVDQRIRPAEPTGPYGPGILGISAFSLNHTGWLDGAQAAIHGTNAPWTIGRAASNGCLHVRNDVLERLYRSTPPGTPVVIRA